MKKYWVLWFVSIPLFILTLLYSLIWANQIAVAPQEVCKPMFIFTPQVVEYCSDIYAIDLFLILLQENVFTLVCLISGIYIIGFLIYLVTKKIKVSSTF